MANALDVVLNSRISIIEVLSAQARQGSRLKTSGNYTTQQRMSNNAQSFWALRETKSTCGRAFADRVFKVQQGSLRVLSKHDLEALEDFFLRQRKAACDTELEHIQESLRDLEEGEIPSSKVIAPRAVEPRFFELKPPLPFSVEVFSVNTSARMLVAKDPDLPFVLKFSPRTQRYQLAERYCGHPECYIEENLSHYYLDPAEIAYVAWAPGMLFIHTETRNETMDKENDYCNLGVKDVEELEALMEHMKTKGVQVEKFTT